MKFQLSAGYGQLSEVHKTPHTGLDLVMDTGTKLRSIVNGTVERVVDYGTRNIGKGVIIRGDDGNAYIYGHLSEINVRKGQLIHAGKEVLGLSGNSGNSTGPHLHFSVMDPSGHYVDPTPVMKALEAATGPQSWLEGAWDSIINFGAPSEELKQRVREQIIPDVDNPVVVVLKDAGKELWVWFTHNLPEIMGYGSIIAGVLIVLGSMVGGGRMMKVIGYYSGALITSILILGGTENG